MLIRIIKNWLRKRLGIVINILPSPFLKNVRDGTLITQILLSYDIITEDDSLLIEESLDSVVCFANYNNHIRHWLARISIELTDTDIYDIVEGESTTAVTLFYDIYLELERDRSRYHIKDGARGPFRVSQVKERALELPDFAPNPLCEPLRKHWDVINWEKDYRHALLSKYHKSRKDYDDYLEEKNIKANLSRYKPEVEDLSALPVDARTDDQPYRQLLAEQKNAMHMDHSCQPDFHEAHRLLAKIKRKNKHKRDLLKTKLQLEQEFVLRLSDEMKLEKQQNFDKIICEKIFKQSNAEKELAEKIMNIRKQKEIMKQNKSTEEEAQRRLRDEEFIRNLFMEDLEARIQFHDERQRLIAEHTRLYEEKMQRKALKHEKICRDIVEDFVDLAIKTAEYKEAYQMEPDAGKVHEWHTLFLKQQKILDDIDLKALAVPPEEVSQEVQEIYQREMARQEVLDFQDLMEYLHHEHAWSFPEGEPDEEKANMIETGQNCLGYGVHRALLRRFPLPIPQKPNLSPEIEVAVCATIQDTLKLPYLKRLLALKNIMVIELQDAVNFCLQAYEIEKKTEFDDPFPDADLKEISPRKPGAKGKGKKGKKEKKPKKEKKDKKGKKGKKGKDAATPAEKLCDDKQAQTPRLFPWEFLNLTNRARLGKFALAETELGNLIDDKILVEMFVEYLASIPDLKGWVLVNFPNNFQQAALLEMALSGKPVPKDYYEEVINKESLASVRATTSGRYLKQVEEDMEDSCVEGSFQPETTPYPDEEEEEELDKQQNVAEKATKRVSILSEQNSDNFAHESFPRSFYEFEPTNIDKETYEKVQKLLPDLVKLAFSSEFYSRAEVEQKIQETMGEPQYTCGCRCAEIPLENLAEPAEGVLDTVSVDPEVEVLLWQVIDRIIEFEATIIPELENMNEDDKPIRRTVPEDPEAIFRRSKILPNPRPIENEEYQTVLTAYIKAIPKPDNDYAEDDNPIPYFAEIAKIDGLEKFYCDQGCYYILEHEEINSETIKCLAKMVIGDYSLPLKSSFELFGERYAEAQFEVGDNIITKKGKAKGKGKEKKKKDKKKKGKGDDAAGGKKGKKDKGKKGKSSDKSSKKSKKSKKSDKKSKKGKGKGKAAEEIPKTFEDKEIQFPFIEEEEEVPEPKPGEPDWEYISLPIPEDIELLLGTFWNNFETNYVNDFKEIFYNRRVTLNDFVPYVSQVRQIMAKFIRREDPRAFYLRQFQKTLNEIDLELRDDPLTKQELTSNIYEFQEKLLGISDKKMLESEQRRRDIIQENWVFRQISELVYNSKVAFQLEIDRFTDSLKFITDYYESIIKKTPSKREFIKEVLQAENVDDYDENFNKIFLEPEFESFETQFHVYIQDVHKSAKLFVDNRVPLAEEAVKEARRLFEAKPKEKKKPKKSKEPKFELDEDVIEQADQIFAEWTCALKGEVARVDCQLDLIQSELTTKLDAVLAWMRLVFLQIFDYIKKLYDDEMASAVLACELLRRCVEDEKIIRPELSFVQESLMALKIALFPDIEDYSDGQFSVPQLSYMYDVFLNLASDGSIQKHTFLLLVQDMFYAADDEEHPEGEGGEEDKAKVPKIWRNLTPKLLEKFNSKYFNCEFEECVEWKDFIVCNLMVPFPTHQELISTRRRFILADPEYSEIVTRNDFAQIPLWFEEEKEESRKSLRLSETEEEGEETTAEETGDEGAEAAEETSLNKPEMGELKSLLFKMYAIGEDQINWTAMLLDFCKDKDRVGGFVKALELALGRCICQDVACGTDFVNEVLDQARIYEEKLEKENDEALNLAKRTVSTAVNEFIEGSMVAPPAEAPEEAVGVIITEIFEGGGETPRREHRHNPSAVAKMSMVGVKSNIFAQDLCDPEDLMEIESGQFLLDLKYSDSEVGFESRADTHLAHFLPFEAIEVVVRAALNSQTLLNPPVVPAEGSNEEAPMCFLDKIAEVYNDCRSAQFNYAVLTHEFLNRKEISELFQGENKFYAGNPVKTIREVVKSEEDFA